MLPERISDTLAFLRLLTFSRIINLLKVYLSYYYSVITGNPVHSGMPFSISVEPTTSCNLRCPECPSGLQRFSRPTGRIPVNKFKEYIDSAGPEVIHLMLYFQGEPFLNRDFFELVRYAKSRKIYTTTSTNGHFLHDDEQAQNIIRSGLDRLIVSFDGTTQEVYEKYRRGGNLQMVRQGIANLLAWKKKTGSSVPHIVLQFLVMGHNEHQMEEARAFARQHNLRIEFKSAQVYDQESYSFIIPGQEKYSRYERKKDGSWAIKSKLPNRCFRMWSGLVVTWDGKVVPCCFDKDAGHVMGDLNKQDLRGIWDSDIYKDFRKAVFTRRNSIDICRNCTEGLKR